MSATVLKRSAILLSAIAILVFCPGCALFQVRGINPFFQGQLADGRQIELRQDMRMDALRNNPQHNYSALVIQASGVNQASIEREIARNSGSATKVPQFAFGKLEARTDESGQRVWFVDKSTGHVIASLDLHSGKATGPQDCPPPWANPSRGALIPPAPPCPPGDSG